jgi:hypothetical protein
MFLPMMMIFARLTQAAGEGFLEDGRDAKAEGRRMN